jgi:hypothetical protein
VRAENSISVLRPWGAKTLFTLRNHPDLRTKPSADAPDG